MKKLIILVTLLSSVSFAEQFKTDSEKLTPESKAMLQKAYDEQIKGHDVSVVVEGHTDARGSSHYNDILSEKRAAEGVIELKKLGAKDVYPVGKGESQLKSLGNTKADHAINRRLEVIVTKKEKKQEVCVVIKGEEAHKNIISLYAVNGQSGLKKTVNGNETKVETETDFGAGLMYQRRFERIYVGGMIDTNRNAGLSVGVGF